MGLVERKSQLILHISGNHCQSTFLCQSHYGKARLLSTIITKIKRMSSRLAILGMAFPGTAFSKAFP